MKAERMWKLLAGGLSVAAVAMTLNTVLSAPRHREIVIRKEADLQQIQTAQSRWAREDAYRAWLDAQQAWKPANLDDLATRTLGAGTARLSPRPAVTAADGWQLREASVEVREASYDEIAMFLSEATAHPPAWRLRELEINPSAEPGKGAMTCVLEALEKKQP